MNILPIAKAASNIVVSMGTGAVVTNAIKSTTPADIKTFQKVTIGVGGLVLSSMVGELASKYTETKIDGAMDTVKQSKDEIKEAQDKK